MNAIAPMTAVGPRHPSALVPASLSAAQIVDLLSGAASLSVDESNEGAS